MAKDRHPVTKYEKDEFSYLSLPTRTDGKNLAYVFTV